MEDLKQQINEIALQNLFEITKILTQDQREMLASAYRTLPPQLKSLNLNSEQQQQVYDIWQNASRQEAKNSVRLQFLKRNLSDMLLTQESVDMDSLQQIQAQIIAHESTQEANKIAGFFQIREVLTPEQTRQFLTLY
jgi:Spy/CpxP family protein refolding chaperone